MIRCVFLIELSEDSIRTTRNRYKLTQHHLMKYTYTNRVIPIWSVYSVHGIGNRHTVLCVLITYCLVVISLIERCDIDAVTGTVGWCGCVLIDRCDIDAVTGTVGWCDCVLIDRCDSDIDAVTGTVGWCGCVLIDRCDIDAVTGTVGWCGCVLVALNRAKALLDRATGQANRTARYFERLTEIGLLLLDLNNHTDQSSAHARDAHSHNERNRRVLRTVLVRIIFISASSCRRRLNDCVAVV